MRLIKIRPSQSGIALALNMLGWLSSSGETAPLTGNTGGASSSVTEAVSDVSLYVGDRAQEAAESLKRYVVFAVK
jgi:hypothetical protein